MRVLWPLLTTAVLLLSIQGRATTFRTEGGDAKAWAKILGAVGITESDSPQSGIVIMDSRATTDIRALAQRHFVILEGLGPAAKAAGIGETTDAVAVRQICDVHAPKMQIIWRQAVDIREAMLPADFRVLATEKWKGAAVAAGKRTAGGGILWLATDPGADGTERYPYILQALADLGLTMPSRATGLWAFFDSAYRIRADSDYLARRWRQAGVSVLHVAAWHNMEADPVQDEYLKGLIEACHRNAILVYAWLELPHVSEKFWAEHPEWREKTAAGQDAELDWRKLMNLQNADCRRQVASEIGSLLGRFDWDGVNVAELYFESLEGAANPARFTPMNDDARQGFAKEDGFDPKALFEAGSPYEAAKNPAALRKFLDYRAQLAARMQREWLDVMDEQKLKKPYLDVVLTHIDDRFEPGIRDALGADVARSLPLMQAHKSTLLVEDPATLWDLGPERYAKLAEKYQELTKDRDHLAVDINVVERYQDVYPTKKQTGVELFELVHQAAASFGQVALYFENSLEKEDLGLLPVAASLAQVRETTPGEMRVEAPALTKIAWQGPAEIDGVVWPLRNSQFVFVPAGRHVLRTGVTEPAVTVADFNGDVRTAAVSGEEAQLSYVSASRAIAVMGPHVSSVEVDGAPYWNRAGAASPAVKLPAGQHVVTLHGDGVR